MLALSTVRTATVYSYHLSIIPGELQGRINSVTRLTSLGGQPVSLAVTGVLLQSIGLYPTILVIAASLAILAVIVTSHRELRRAPRLAHIVAETDPSAC